MSIYKLALETSEMHLLLLVFFLCFCSYCVYSLNRCGVLLQIETSISIKGTSIKTPTTVASEAPDESPNSIADVAIATSK